VLTFPATTTALKGIYRVDVGGPTAGILPEVAISSIFWKWL
jgi:hypothetical protein